MKPIYLITNVLAIIVFSFWSYSKPGWDSFGTLVGAIGVLIAQFIKNESNNSKVKMSQKSGKNSTSYQSGGDTHIDIDNHDNSNNQKGALFSVNKFYIGSEENKALTYIEIRQIFLDLFKVNSIELKIEAAQIAQKRAEEITDSFLIKLIEKSPSSIQELSQSGMQDALFTAQKEYAKSGDKDMRDLLVDLLIDRASTPQRTMFQIALDDALQIIPKMTEQHLDTLSVIFFIKKVSIPTEINLQPFIDYIQSYILPFIDNLTGDRQVYNHLESLGCGQIRHLQARVIDDTIIRKNGAILQKGFTEEEFEAKVGKIEEFESILMRSLLWAEKLQFKCVTEFDFYARMQELNPPGNVAKEISNLYENSIMTYMQAIEFLTSIDNRLNKEFYTLFTQSSLHQMELTSVGIVIAHANYKRRTNKTLDLSAWIK